LKVLHGSVTVHTGDHVIAQLHAGQCFGEMALIQDETRMADVSAETYCDLITLSKERFLELIREFPELDGNVQKLIDQRRAKAAARSDGNQVA